MFTPVGRVLSVALLVLPAIVASRYVDNRHLVLFRRQNVATATSATASATTRARPTTSAQGSATTTSSSGAAAPEWSPPDDEIESFPAGAMNPTVSGAPELPDISHFDPSEFPSLDVTPPIDSPEMKDWIASVDLANAPTWSRTGIDGCSNVTYNAAAIAESGPEARCWWTCQSPGGRKCTRDTDITYCPTKNTWGASFDDGPSPYTPKLLNYLSAQDIKATFFVVGSRVVSRPEMVQAEYMAGHQISVHTWSHKLLTTLSNEEIIAELAWTKEAIRRVTGVTPNTMRPPYGDIDDRVRYISLALGLTPIIWTQVGDKTFDTQDWRLGDPNSKMTERDILHNFNSFLELSRGLSTGFIVLAHDLYETSVDLAVNHVLPSAMAFTPQLTLEPIITCLGVDNSRAYAETMGRSSNTSSEASVNTTTSSTLTSSSSTTISLSATATSSSAVVSAPAGAANVRISGGNRKGEISAVLIMTGLWICPLLALVN